MRNDAVLSQTSQAPSTAFAGCSEIDGLNCHEFSAIGKQPILVVQAGELQWPMSAAQAVVVGIDSVGALPRVDPTGFDVLLTTAQDAPAPWVTIRSTDLRAHVDNLTDMVAAKAVAATTLCQVLRLTENLSIGEALAIESLAYSTLLAGHEFAVWLSRRLTTIDRLPTPDAEVKYARAGDHVTLTLANPANRNAMTARMRDSLYSELVSVLEDPTLPGVSIRAAGRCFSVGGMLSEFGTAPDPATAHVIRTLRSCAHLIARLGQRVDVLFSGACIGSGLELGAAAAYRAAKRDAYFELPELKMGLIPGAGGTVTVPRAIGRHRSAWMMLTGRRIDAKRALDWRLIHGIED